MKAKFSPEALEQMRREILGKPLTIDYGNGPQEIGVVIAAEVSPDGLQVEMVVSRDLPPEALVLGLSPCVNVSVSFKP